jgi:3-deoxy-manno-octulosonate cytidylyltransferase (CMP-KDO synthetase)
MIILVGNSCKNIGLKLGKLIDEFEYVVRFNNFILNDKFNEDYGFKTDIHVINNIKMKSHPEIKNKFLLNNKLPVIKNYNSNITIIPYSFLNSYVDKYKFNIHLSSGFSIILYYLYYLNYKKIYITNFDFCLNKQIHYFDNEKLPLKPHDFKKEWEITKDLISQGKIIILEDSLNKINNNLKILCCIPARYNSSRLPGKPLLKFNNKTIINLVYEKAQQTIVDEIIVLTDDQRIYDEVLSFGGKCVIINEDCLNGTERIIIYLKSINHDKYDIIVNIQGDEPFIKPHVINQTINNFIKKKPECSTICFKTLNQNEILSKSRGKVVVDNFNNIIYCSRNIIPSNKKENIIKNHEYNIHVGIFVYDKNYLLEHFCKENTKNQLLEDIEWLKIIEQGFKINTIFSEEMERGVDTIEDYDYLKKKYEF